MLVSTFVMIDSASATVVLPDAVSNEYFGINFADNEKTSSSVGTLTYSGQPGCGSICVATTQLGDDPSASATINEIAYQFTSGGSVKSSLGYYVEYLDAPGTYTVSLHSLYSLAAPDESTAVSVALTFGPAGENTTSLGNFASTTYQAANCVNGCPTPGFITGTASLAPDTQVAMVANTLYYVQLDILFSPQATNIANSASISTALLTSSKGKFVYSPGVFPFTPAPGSHADYFGENTADLTVWRPATGYWYSLDGSGAFLSSQWGAPTDLPLIGDFDGDGKSDVAVFRPSTGYWYVIQSSNNTVVAKQWGEATDIPVVGDFDGDGKTDIAVFRPSTGYWYIIQSSNGAVVSKQWGIATDIPVAGDFDGDGKTDIAVYRPSTGYWYIIQSSNGAVVSKQWGVATDVPLLGDFDGDEKTDIAVYRPSTGYWYVVQSSDGQIVAKQWGQIGDVPVARDYDGDGKTDIAVWRPATGYWYIVDSSTGETDSVQWGSATDIPVNSLSR